MDNKTNKNKSIQISLKYVSNFKPDSLLKLKNTNYSKQQHSKIFCKNFILFLIILKNIFKKSNFSVFTKPNKSNIYNILRAPYKNKMSKHQIKLNRFLINVTFSVKLDQNVIIDNKLDIIYILNSLKKFYSFFESNICFQHKSTVSFNFKLNNFFFI